MSRRREKGEGTILAVKRDGKVHGYRGRMTYQGKSVYGPTVKKRSDALPSLKAKLAQIAHRLDEEDLVEQAGPTLLSFLESRRDEDWVCAALIRRVGSMGQLHLLQLTDKHLIKLRDTAPALAPSSKVRYQRHLETLLKREGFPVTAEKPKVDQPDVLVLTIDQQRRLIERAVQPRTKLALMILLDTGVRAGEACGMKHEDRFEDGMPIQRQVGKNNRVKKKLKTDRSRAIVPLSTRLKALIGPPQKGFVIGVDESRPMNPTNLRRMVLSVAEHSDFEGLTPNDLRHTALVNLLRAGVDPATAASITRHSVDTALKVYHRAIPEVKDEAMKKLEAFLSGAA